MSIEFLADCYKDLVGHGSHDHDALPCAEHRNYIDSQNSDTQQDKAFPVAFPDKIIDADLHEIRIQQFNKNNNCH